MDPSSPSGTAAEPARRRKKPGKKPDEQSRSKTDYTVPVVRAIGGALVVVSLIAAYLIGKESAPSTSQAELDIESIAVTESAVDESIDSPERLKALEEFERGLVLYSKEKFGEAAGAFRNTLKIDPGFPGVRFEMAKVLLAQGDALNAVVELEKSLRLHEEVLDSFLLKAEIYGGLGQMESAIGNCTLAAQAVPSAAKPYLVWGQLLRRIGKPREASEKFRQAAIRADDPAESFKIECMLLLALVESENEDWIKTELQPRLAQMHPSAKWLLAGAVHSIKGEQWKQAREYLERARAAVPPELFAWFVADSSFDFCRSNPELSGILATKSDESRDPAFTPVESETPALRLDDPVPSTL